MGSTGAVPGPSLALEGLQSSPKQGPTCLDWPQGYRHHCRSCHHLPVLQPLWRGPGEAEGGRKAPGWGSRGGLWPGGCGSGRDRGQLPVAELFCPVVCLAPSAARGLNAIGHGRSSICRPTPGLPEMKGKHVLFLVKPCSFPGWGKSGSRHSRNIFSVYSLVIRKPHLRVERRGSKMKRECWGWRRHVGSN